MVGLNSCAPNSQLKNTPTLSLSRSILTETVQNVHCNISNIKSCWFFPLQDLQIISLTSPLLDILDLHPITTHLSKLPIFRDAATKWHHSSRIPAFPNISRRDIFSRLDVCCTNISPETCSPCPVFIRWWKVRCAKVGSLISF